MNQLTALYIVQLLPTDRKHLYTLNRITKEGNCPSLNLLLAWQGEVQFRKLEPQAILNDYILYPLKFGDKGNQQVLMLETAPYLYPFGIVNIPASADCILFRISEDLTIEFFVSAGNANLTTQLLTMLMDGSLSEKTDSLKSI